MTNLLIIVFTIIGFVISALVVLGIGEYKRFMKARKEFYEEWCKKHDAKLTPHQIVLDKDNKRVD